jgi:mono/diheme cytochrome c family protein
MQKPLIYLIRKFGAIPHRVLIVAALLFIIWLLTYYSSQWSEKLWDDDAGRGAVSVATDAFADRVAPDRIVYLPEQNWAPADSLWFYSTTQGSDLLPYDFFLVLEQPDNTARFRDNENIDRYRYLTQKATPSNPDGLPVGMAKDIYQGKAYMGFTCAACHTGQVNYRGTGIRIDGGPASADMDSFMHDLGAALAKTESDDTKKARFVQAVLELGNYGSKEEILKDLKTYSLRTRVYNFINRSPTDYGYGRLDAFGRIYNRVLQHVLTEDDLRAVLKDTLPEQDLNSILPGFDKVLSEQDREHILEGLSELLTLRQQTALKNRLFNPPNAPVSYPFLWDIPQHDYVQWNGIADNSGEGPIGRNTGEVIGVFATLDWSQKHGWSLSAVIGGQGIHRHHVSYKSSVDPHNLFLLETQLNALQSPRWPENILPRLDRDRVQRGAAIFGKRCLGCHQTIDPTDPDRRVIATMVKTGVIGTDPTMANNGANRTGLAGILSGQYVDLGVGKMLLKDRAPVAALLTKADINVVATPDPDKWFFQRWSDWAHDLVVAYFQNNVKASMKVGDYDADTTARPLASLYAYKARSLNGIWATAPYLHNGSVPTLYDLLLPAHKEAGDPPGMEYRPARFLTGSREFDPEHVGLNSADYAGTTFDTGVAGNSNLGHEYGTRDSKFPDSTVNSRALTREERLDLLEYLKSL